MPTEGYTSVAIPDELYDEIVRYVKRNPRLGYTGVPEFVRDVLREVLQKGKEAS